MSAASVALIIAAGMTVTSEQAIGIARGQWPDGGEMAGVAWHVQRLDRPGTAYYLVVLSTTLFAWFFLFQVTVGIIKDESSLETTARFMPRRNAYGDRCERPPRHCDHSDEDDPYGFLYHTSPAAGTGVVSPFGRDDPRSPAPGKIFAHPKCASTGTAYWLRLPRKLYRNCCVVLGNNPLLWLVPSLLPMENPLNAPPLSPSSAEDAKLV